MEFLNQTKLTKIEWTKMESQIHNIKEKEILNMIDKGYENRNINTMTYQCLSSFLNIDSNFDSYIYSHVLKDKIKKLNVSNILKIDHLNINEEVKKSKKMNKSNIIKITNSLKLFEKEDNETRVIEFVMMQHLKQLSKLIQKQISKKDKKYGLLVYNLYILYCSYEFNINVYFKEIIKSVIDYHIVDIQPQHFLKYVSKYIEHNSIFKYEKLYLYQHQKDIFETFKTHKEPKLVFYCAPTSSGKTLTPLALTKEYKVIFMCASKHIGLSLAKSGYFLNKKIGFAFGCNDVEHIRLNYNAVNSYKECKYGKRKLPDHSDGTNVEIMISDLMSYEYAMNYMKAFNDIYKIVLFWDEPTIGLDVPDHHLHNIISKNWKLNVIPNIVFSCATLPKQEKIQPIVTQFNVRFENSYIKYIESYDQTTNLMIYDEYGNILMPHMYFKNHDELCLFLDYQGKKYYKFYNCNECAKFLLFYQSEIDSTFIDRLFGQTIMNMTMDKIKDVYVSCLKEIKDDSWISIQNKYIKKYPLNNDHDHNIGCNLTTNHSSSLTNGPSLYISDQVQNICKYLLNIAKIDTNVINLLSKKINENAIISDQLTKKRKDYEDKIEKFKDSEKIMENMRFPQDVLDLHKQIEILESNIQTLHLNNIFKPNTRDHFQKWNTNKEITYDKCDVYTSHVEDENIRQIMELNYIPSLYKILLLMGIGVFSNDLNSQNKDNIQVIEDTNKYLEIMKQLAEEKSLYLIIANSDYIYGTNYQFSHCYLGKDMKQISQEKIIQCIGRIGRQEKNKHFSFRFRHRSQIDEFYKIPKQSIEVDNMNKLFL